MNTITVGQQHYRWKVQEFSWIKALECTVYNLVDPQAQLSIVLSNKEKDYCTPKQISNWINLALRQGWYSECKSYRLVHRHNNPHLLPIPNSLQEEKQLIEQIQQHYPNLLLPTALERSNIAYQWAALEKELGFLLPTALQQLYSSLGNGDFGPDYGFFLLDNSITSDKITLLEAYKEVQAANIKDWDWQLPKEVLPFLYWGSDIYSVIDVTTTNYTVYVLDMNLKKTHHTWQACYWQHCTTFFDWLEKWAGDQQSGRSLWLEMYQLRGLL
ncbi:MAG: SMI1/KNR4 family protein [Aureispira sp.]